MLATRCASARLAGRSVAVTEAQPCSSANRPPMPGDGQRLGRACHQTGCALGLGRFELKDLLACETGREHARYLLRQLSRDGDELAWGDSNSLHVRTFIECNSSLTECPMLTVDYLRRISRRECSTASRTCNAEGQAALNATSNLADELPALQDGLMHRPQTTALRMSGRVTTLGSRTRSHSPITRNYQQLSGPAESPARQTCPWEALKR